MDRPTAVVFLCCVRTSVKVQNPSQLMEQTCSERSESIKQIRIIDISLILLISCEIFLAHGLGRGTYAVAYALNITPSLPSPIQGEGIRMDAYAYGVLWQGRRERSRTARGGTIRRFSIVRNPRRWRGISDLQKLSAGETARQSSSLSDSFASYI